MSLRTPTRPIHMLTPAVLGAPHPLPPSFVPKDAVHKHKVTDQETWRTVANKYKTSVTEVAELILYNFQTLKPEYVNWYLKSITGCDKTTDDMNWAFSDSASPGYIYIPSLNFSSQTIVGNRPRRTDISQWFSAPPDPQNMLDPIGKVIDVIGAIDLGLAILLPTLEIPLSVGVAIAAIGALGPILAVAGPTADAINYQIKNERLSGFSQGLVVGVEKKKTFFAKVNFLDSHHNFNNQFIDYRTRFDNEYKRAFAAGYATGLGFTQFEGTTFFQHLWANMSQHPRDKYGSDIARWSERIWVNYFIETAAVFRRLHLR